MRRTTKPRLLCREPARSRFASVAVARRGKPPERVGLRFARGLFVKLVVELLRVDRDLRFHGASRIAAATRPQRENRGQSIRMPRVRSRGSWSLRERRPRGRVPPAAFPCGGSRRRRAPPGRPVRPARLVGDFLEPLHRLMTPRVAPDGGRLPGGLSRDVGRTRLSTGRRASARQLADWSAELVRRRRSEDRQTPPERRKARRSGPFWRAAEGTRTLDLLHGKSLGSACEPRELPANRGNLAWIRVTLWVRFQFQFARFRR